MLMNTRHPEQLPWDVITILVHDLRNGITHQKGNPPPVSTNKTSAEPENPIVSTQVPGTSPCEHDDDNSVSDGSGPVSAVTSDLSSSLHEEEKRTSSSIEGKHRKGKTTSLNEPADSSKESSFFEEKWNLRYKELLEFMKKTGHVNVPHTFHENQQLARWVKRQRRQYKLMQERKPSAMTQERIDILESVGFVWDSHELNWLEKINVLKEFKRENGHCNVAVNHKENKLGTWVKCQRRQYKLFQEGKPSAMDADRIKELEKLGFEWKIRSREKGNH